MVGKVWTGLDAVTSTGVRVPNLVAGTDYGFGANAFISGVVTDFGILADDNGISATLAQFVVKVAVEAAVGGHVGAVLEVGVRRDGRLLRCNVRVRWDS